MNSAAHPVFASAMATPTTATTTSQRSPNAPPLSSDIGGAGLVGVVLSATVLAALITGAINLWLAQRKSREEERARIRNTCADAYRAYTEYKEFPYAIRRRDVNRPAEERLRLSEALREVQGRLSYYRTWTTLEARTVGAAYAELVRQVRMIAGGAMQRAWTEPGLERDDQVNIAPDFVDLRPLEPHEQTYRDAVAEHLRTLAPRWSRYRRIR